MASKKHYSDIDVNDVCIKLEYTCNDNAGCVTVCLMNKDCVVASNSWETDAEGYMTHAKFKEALSYALGLSEARIAVRKNIGLGRPRANGEAVAKAMEMYASGEYTVNEIANATNISCSTVHRYAKERGIKHQMNSEKMGRPKANKEAVARAIEMYASGEHTVNEIAKEVGISSATINRKVKECGIKRQKKSA